MVGAAVGSKVGALDGGSEGHSPHGQQIAVVTAEVGMMLNATSNSQTSSRGFSESTKVPSLSILARMTKSPKNGATPGAYGMKFPFQSPEYVYGSKPSFLRKSSNFDPSSFAPAK